MRRFVPAALIALTATLARAQDPGVAPKPFDQKHAGNDKMHMVAHVPGHPGAWKAADIELEQDPDRPYVYLCGFINFDVQIYDIRNTSAPKLVYDWTIENPELHRGIGAMDGKYFKIGNSYYYAQSFQFMQGSPDADLGAVIFDVTGLPDPSEGQGRRAHSLSAVAGRLPQHLRVQALRRPRPVLRDDQPVEGAHLRSRRRS